MKKAPKLSIGPISREQAIKIDPLYVKFIDRDYSEDRDAVRHVYDVCGDNLKRGQLVLSVDPNDRKKFIIAKVSNVDSNSFAAIDGPVVRIKNCTGSWRVDGDTYCVPVD